MVILAGLEVFLGPLGTILGHLGTLLGVSWDFLWIFEGRRGGRTGSRRPQGDRKETAGRVSGDPPPLPKLVY